MQSETVKIVIGTLPYIDWVGNAKKLYDQMTQQKTDPIVDSVLNRIKSRSEAGMKKYGVTMARTDVSTLQWLRHAQEEALDMAVYLERLIQDEITEAKERAYDAAARELFP